MGEPESSRAQPGPNKETKGAKVTGGSLALCSNGGVCSQLQRTDETPKALEY